MRIKKTFQGSLPENTVVNTQSDSQTNAYSCDYINNNSNMVKSYSPSVQTMTSNARIDDMIFTLTTKGKPILVTWTIPCRAYGGSPAIAVLVDGDTKFSALDSLGERHYHCMSVLLNNIPAGEHTFELWCAKGNAEYLQILEYDDKVFSATEL